MSTLDSFAFTDRKALVTGATSDYHPAINRPHFTLATDFEPLPLTPLLAYLQELTP